MKLISYTIDGAPGWGAVVGRKVSPLCGAPGFERAPSIAEALRRFGVQGVVSRAEQVTAVLDLDSVALLPVIPSPVKIICVGLNYRAHIAETGREFPTHPVLFTRFPASQVGHGAPLVRPRVSSKFDYEGELAVVIGQEGRHVSRGRALEHVAGYACFNDGSIRDWQRHSSHFTAGKNFDASGAFGPWLATSDEIPEPSSLTLMTRVNGIEVQRAPVSDLLFTVPALIEYISTFTRLEPGDVIATGTPAGVGAYREPKLWLESGDVVEVEIDRIGVLRNPVVDEESG